MYPYFMYAHAVRDKKSITSSMVAEDLSFILETREASCRVQENTSVANKVIGHNQPLQQHPSPTRPRPSYVP